MVLIGHRWWPFPTLCIAADQVGPPYLCWWDAAFYLQQKSNDQFSLSIGSQSIRWLHRGHIKVLQPSSILSLFFHVQPGAYLGFVDTRIANKPHFPWWPKLVLSCCYSVINMSVGFGFSGWRLHCGDPARPGGDFFARVQRRLSIRIPGIDIWAFHSRKSIARGQVSSIWRLRSSTARRFEVLPPRSVDPRSIAFWVSPGNISLVSMLRVRARKLGTALERFSGHYARRVTWSLQSWSQRPCRFNKYTACNNSNVSTRRSNTSLWNRRERLNVKH